MAHRGHRWVLRISQNLSAAQARAEHRLLGEVRAAGLPFGVPEPVPTLAGDTVAETQAGPATLCRWIPGMRPDLATEPALERFGQAIGLLSRALRTVPWSDAPQDWRGDPLRAHPDAPETADLARALRDAGMPAARVRRLEAAARRVLLRAPEAGEDLPVQVVHGDLGASNALVDERTGVVTGVLDFELAGPDARVQDLLVGLLLSGALAGPGWARAAPPALVRAARRGAAPDQPRSRRVPAPAAPLPRAGCLRRPRPVPAVRRGQRGPQRRGRPGAARGRRAWLAVHPGALLTVLPPRAWPAQRLTRLTSRTERLRQGRRLTRPARSSRRWPAASCGRSLRVPSWSAARDGRSVQVVAGDLGASNALVDERTGEVTGVLDFELAGPDARVQDLLVGLLLSGALAGPGWARRAAALVRGHAAVLLLDQAEIRAVPDLLVLRCVGSVFWRAGGAAARRR